MKLNMLKKKIVGALLGLSLVVGIGIASSVTTQAQWPNNGQYERDQRRRQRDWERDQRRRQRNDDWRYRNPSNDDYRFGGSAQLRQTALNAGYNEGVKEGRKDRQRGERFEYRDEEDFRNANTDYSSRLGNRELYRQYFRQGFANGYNDGYRGY
ncbi:MAG: hypothetical protein ACREBG_05690 [Pyrinomonadaceae bacterium]